MLGEQNVVANVAVKDLTAAKKFYEGQLGLSTVGNDPNGVMYKCGSSKMLVYESQFAGTNQATSASWDVEDVESVVTALKGRGIKFESYDIPGVDKQGDVHVMGELKAAWFKDPDGNILCVSNHKA